MRIAEIILSLAALLALALNLTQVYESIWALAVPFAALALFYLIAAIPLFDEMPGAVHSEKSAAAPVTKKIAAQITGFIFSFAITGILAAQAGWRLAPFFWAASMMALVPVGALNLGRYMLRPKKTHRNVALRAAVLLLCGILVVVLQWRPPQT